jgi:surfeit locus 1 family protein
LVGRRAATRRRLTRAPARGRLLVPAIVSLLFAALGIGLGVWQVQRLHWKLALLAQIDAAEAAPAIPLAADPLPYQKVAARARPIAGAVARYGFTTQDDRPGAQLLYAEQPDSGAPLLVMAGWAPDGVLPPPPAGLLQGYVRLPARPGLFSPADDPAQRRFFTLDPAAIGRALGLPVRPYVLVLLGADRPGVYPQPATSLPRPPNNHLQYAITWFALAGVVLVIFSIHALRVPA